MKIEVSDYYKDKYKNAYVIINKEPRRICVLRDYENKLHSMAYAKYLYTSYHKCDIPDDCQVDHINGDRMDDRIENLQCISANYNIRKDRKGREMVMLVCPICGVTFLYPKHNVKKGQEHCCSRSCGGKKSILTAKARKENNKSQA